MSAESELEKLSLFLYQNYPPPRELGTTVDYAIHLLDTGICPHDCDNCHGDWCACDRLGCQNTDGT